MVQILVSTHIPDGLVHNLNKAHSLTTTPYLELRQLVNVTDLLAHTGSDFGINFIRLQISSRYHVIRADTMVTRADLQSDW